MSPDKCFKRLTVVCVAVSSGPPECTAPLPSVSLLLNSVVHALTCSAQGARGREGATAPQPASAAAGLRGQARGAC